MDERAKIILERILAKTPAELVDHEIAFLRARRTYLKPHQKEEFKEFLVEEKPPLYVSKKKK